MRMCRVVLFSLLTLQPAVAPGADVSSITKLPPSDGVASGAPPCDPKAHVTADKIVERIGPAIDERAASALTFAIEARAFEPGDAKEWVQANLRPYEGPSSCATICVAIPSSANYTSRIDAWDTYRSSSLSVAGTLPRTHFGIGWSWIDEAHSAETKLMRIVCVDVRQWKHNWWRYIRLSVDFE